MKNFIAATAFVGLSLCLSTSAQAQLMPGMIDMMPSINTTFNNIQNTLRNEALSRDREEDEEVRRRAILGQSLIESGKATTLFASTLAGTQNLAANIPWHGTLKDDKPGQLKHLQKLIADFKLRLKSNNFLSNDYADARALAVAINYEIFKGEKVTAAQLQALRKQYRGYYLQDVYFQGTPSSEKQFSVERLIFLTLEDVNENAPSAKDKELAGKVLREMTGKNVERIEINADGLGDRAERIVAAKVGTTIFERDDKNLVSLNYLLDRYSYLEKNAAFYIELMRGFDQTVVERGGKTNDAAWSNAVAFAIAYEIYTGGAVRLNDQQFKWILNEMNEDIVKSVDYQGFSNSQKQEYYETTGLHIMIILSNYREGVKAGKDSLYGTFLRSKSVENSKAKLDEIFSPRNFDEYELTATGFVKK